jgi:hypothetical protein
MAIPVSLRLASRDPYVAMDTIVGRVEGELTEDTTIDLTVTQK